MLEGTASATLKWDLARYIQNIPYLARYLSLLLSTIGRTERRVATTRYIEGLLLPGRRKFIRPLAERLNVDAQSLQQAIAHSPWDDQQVWSVLRREIIPALEPFEVWAISERAWAKQGAASVGVSNQRCGARGKKSHCQLSLELLGSDGSMAAPLAARLYLPESWAADRIRRLRADVPEDVNFFSKPALAIELLREALNDGVSPAIVVADARYGNDVDFRSAALRLGLELFLEVEPTSLKVWEFELSDSLWDNSPLPTAISLDKIVLRMGSGEWRTCCWRGPDGISHRTRLAIREIFLNADASDSPDRLEKLWLVVDWPAGQMQPHCYLGHFHRPPSYAKCLRLCHHRSYFQEYQRSFEGNLDLACYQGRSWKGFHHHLVLSAAAYLFTLTADLERRRKFWQYLPEDMPLDSAIATETARMASVLLRSGASTAPIRKASNGNCLQMTA